MQVLLSSPNPSCQISACLFGHLSKQSILFMDGLFIKPFILVKLEKATTQRVKPQILNKSGISGGHLA